MRRLVRITDEVDKISFLDWLLHLFGIHLFREVSSNRASGKYYCRICGKEFNSFSK